MKERKCFKRTAEGRKKDNSVHDQIIGWALRFWIFESFSQVLWRSYLLVRKDAYAEFVVCRMERESQTFQIELSHNLSLSSYPLPTHTPSLPQWGSGPCLCYCSPPHAWEDSAHFWHPNEKKYHGKKPTDADTVNVHFDDVVKLSQRWVSEDAGDWPWRWCQLRHQAAF